MDEKIIEILKKGNACFFLGAGISMIPPSCLPSWWQINHAILDALADESATIVPEVRDLASKIKEREEEGRLPPEFVAEIITNRIGKSYFEVLQVLEGDKPNLAHLWLATLAKAGLLRVIITTNFDTLIERAFKQIGAPLKVCVDPEEYKEIEINENSTKPCILLKLHGTATRPETCIDTLAQRKKGLHPYITQALDKIGFQTFWIVLGYSGADLEAEPNYLGIRHRMNNSPGFAWLHLPDRKPLPVISELAELYGNERGLIEYGVLPDWLNTCERIIPMDIQVPHSSPIKNEEIQKIKDGKSEYLKEQTRKWASHQGVAECAIILSDIGVDAGFYEVARSILLKLYEQEGEFKLSPIGNALVCQMLAEISRRLGENEKRLKYVQDAAKFFQEANNIEGYQASGQDIANIKRELGYFEEAEKDLMNYLDYTIKVNDYEGQIHALLSLNSLYRESDQYDKALESLNKAIPIATEHGLEVLRSNGLLGMALVETELGDIEHAEKHLLEIIDTFTRLGDDNSLSEALRALSQIHFMRGDTKSALELLEQATQKAFLVGDKSRIIRAERARGDFLIKLGNHGEAISILRNSLKNAEILGDYSLIITIMQSLGLALQSQGNINKAVQIYQEAILKAEQNGLEIKAAGIKNNLGIILEQNGDIESALKYYKEVDLIFNRTGLLDSMAGSKGNLGNINFRMGHFDEARRYYEESINIAEKLQNIDVILRTKYNIANVVLQSGDTDGAKIQFQEAIDLAKKYDQKGLKDMFQLNYAGLLFQLEDFGSAIELYGDTYISSIERKDYLQAGTAMYYSGLGYFRLNQIDKGIRALEEAIESYKMLDEEPAQLTEAQQTLDSIKKQLNS